MDFTRLLTRSALIAFIAILLRMLGAPWQRAKEVARLIKHQDHVGGLLFAHMLLGYLCDGARLIVPGEDEAFLQKRLDRLAAFARDFRGAWKEVVKDAKNLRLQIKLGDGLAFIGGEMFAAAFDVFAPLTPHHNTS
jgi:hypothetical protein